MTSNQKSSFRGFSPPSWICDINSTTSTSTSSHNNNNNLIPTLYDQSPPPQSSTSSLNTSRNFKNAKWKNPLEDDAEIKGYTGPTITRKNVLFVRSKGLDGSITPTSTSISTSHDHNVDRKGKGKAVVDVKELYESIIRTSTSTLPLSSLPSSHAIPKAPDVDLTFDSDSSASSSEDEDDVQIINPQTQLPYPPLLKSKVFRKRKPQIPSIPDILGPTSSTSKPIIPPIHYGIGSNNIGWKLLVKNGWKEGDGLGAIIPSTISTSMIEDGADTLEIIEEINHGTGGIGRKVPIRAELKIGRGGLGSSNSISRGMTKKEKEVRRLKEEKERLERRGKGSRGIARKQKADKIERAHWNEYLKRG